MRIESLKLTNVKSYGDGADEIKLGSGLNLIKGQNGAGKSTILEAIGYALFDSAIYSQGDFVRRGQPSGQIAVTILSSIDDREYEVIRGINNNRYFAYDPITKVKLAEGKSDTLSWLHDQMHIDLQTDLRSLFNDAVGVPQGTMTAIFLEGAAERQKKFNKLLRFDDYKIAYDNLHDTQKYVEQLKVANEKDQKYIEGKLERLPTVEHDIEELTADLKRDQDDEEIGKAQLESTQAELDRLNQLEQQLGDLDRQILDQQGQLDRLNDNLKRANSDVEESRHAAEQISELTLAFEAYSEADQSLTVLDKARKKRDRLKDSRASLQRDLVRVQETTNNLMEKLREIEQAEEAIVTLTPEAERQRELSKDLDAAKANSIRYTELREQIGQKQDKLAEIDGDLSNLEHNLAQREIVAKAIDFLQHQREEIEANLEKLATQREPLDSDRQRLESDLNWQRERENDRRNTQRQVDDTQELLKQAQDRLLSLQDEVNQHRDIQTQIDNLQSQQESYKHAETTANASLKHIEEQRSQIAEYRHLLDNADMVCPVCQQPLDAKSHANSLKHYQQEERHLDDDHRQGQDTAAKAKSELKLIGKNLKVLQKQSDTLASEAQLEYPKGEIDRLETQLSALHENLGMLQDAPDRIQQLEGKLDDLREQLAELESQKDYLDTAHKQYSEDIETQQGEINRLPRPEERERKAAERQKLVGEIGQAQLAIDDLANSAAQEAKLQAELTELGDPIRRLANATETAGKRPATDQSMTEYQRQRDEIQLQIDKCDDRLAQFNALDTEMDQARTQLETYRDAHSLYLANRPLADKLEQRQQEAGRLAHSCEELIEQQDRKRQERDALAQNYDADQHSQWRDAMSSLRGTLAEIQGRIKANQPNLDKLKHELVDLQAKQEQQQALNDETNVLQARGTAVEFVRNTIKAAGPAMTKRLVEIVGAEASRIFGDIMGDYSTTLDWHEDYGIGVIRSGEERDFRLMSGGEQMVAAISIRLALLTHLSEIRFAFFDEPTVNLDGTRRVQLAQRLNQIRNLQQVFVISHDDTFEENCQHVVLIEKIDDMSHVEVR